MTQELGPEESRKEVSTTPDPSATNPAQSGLSGFWRWLLGRYRPEKRYMRGPDSLSVAGPAPRDFGSRQRQSDFDH